MQAWAVLAVLENFIGQFRLVFDSAESVLEEKIGDARKEADRLDAVFFSLINERRKNATTRTLALGCRHHDDGAHFAEMRTIKVQRAAA